MNWHFIFMIPVAFIGGMLLRRSLNAQPKHKTRKTIQQDYFDIAPCKEPDLRHEPDDDTHSIILETVEKRWRKLITWRHCDDPLSFFLDVAILALGSLGLLILAQALSEEASNRYLMPCSIAVICIAITYGAGGWLKRHLRLLKDVRNRNYTCKLRPMEKPLRNADVCLEVMETNAEDFADMTLYFDNGWHCASILLKINRHQA